MHNLGDQWPELGSDGKMHMYKAVEGREGAPTCSGCYLLKHDGKCAIPLDNLNCPLQVSLDCVVKDLGILNEEGCLPSPWGGYPTIIHEIDQDRIENDEDVHYDNLWCVEINDSVLVCTNEYPTEQEAKDAWNRRV